jgi:hypothetical protein
MRREGARYQMRFFIIGREGNVLDEFDADDVCKATSADEWRNAPLGAFLVHLATGDVVAERKRAAIELLRGAA